MLKVEKVTYRLPNKKIILRDFSMQLQSQERIALTGPSGYGKTTLAKIISGYIKKYEGKVTWNDTSVLQSPYCPVQLIFQHPEETFNPLWKIEDSLKEAWDIDQETLWRFGIEEPWLERWPNELSGGQLQRLAIVRALGGNTKFIVADEITTGLDALTQAIIWKSLLSYIDSHKIGLLLITHNQFLARAVCQRIETIVHERSF